MRSLIFVREILDITSITITGTVEPGKGALGSRWLCRKECTGNLSYGALSNPIKLDTPYFGTWPGPPGYRHQAGR